jgi:hypothetical protein
VPGNILPDGDPRKSVDPNLRCLHFSDELYEVNRYIDAFKALKPGNESRVVFATISGVPTDLVDGNARIGVDFSDASQRDAYYDRILNDERMKPVPDPTKPMGQGNIKTSCESATGKAYPPRRIVEVAKGLGENSIVQSICADDFGPAFDAITDRIGHGLRTQCLTKTLKRQSDEKVACDLVWVLPVKPDAAHTVPTECADRDFLSVPTDRTTKTKDGRAVCVQKQAGQPMADAGQGFISNDGGHGQLVSNDPRTWGTGWYYDDFSNERARDCANPNANRIAFTAEAKPPAGVEVFLDCD